MTCINNIYVSSLVCPDMIDRINRSEARTIVQLRHLLRPGLKATRHLPDQKMFPGLISKSQNSVPHASHFGASSSSMTTTSESSALVESQSKIALIESQSVNARERDIENWHVSPWIRSVACCCVQVTTTDGVTRQPHKCHEEWQENGRMFLRLISKCGNGLMWATTLIEEAVSPRRIKTISYAVN
jgi:hypothetical protein